MVEIRKMIVVIVVSREDLGEVVKEGAARFGVRRTREAIGSAGQVAV
jgi:hypothetical protein